MVNVMESLINDVSKKNETREVVDHLTFILSLENGFMWDDAYASDQLDEILKDNLVRESPTLTIFASIDLGRVYFILFLLRAMDTEKFKKFTVLGCLVIQYLVKKSPKTRIMRCFFREVTFCRLLT